MKAIYYTFCLILMAVPLFAVPPTSLTVGEGFEDPIGFYDPTPTFSWKLPAGVKSQSAYRIEVKSSRNNWDSGWIKSDQSTFVPYSGLPFPSREQIKWSVQYKDESGDVSAWSEPAQFEMGLLLKKDWKAQWIQPSQELDLDKEPVSTLRRSFSILRPVEKARLYVTARGLFSLNLNGQRVGNDVFANGWTSYHKELNTLTYDVGELVKSGENSLQAMLGFGWYAGRMTWMRGNKGKYGKYPELLLQLEITYADGSKDLIVSDGEWEGTLDGPITSSSIYDGESYDERLKASNWQLVTANPDLGSARLKPKTFPPVRAIQTLAPKAITEPTLGHYVFDLGQNMVGWPKLRIPVEKDQTVTIRFAEMLNQDGTLYTENYRSAISTNYYTAAKTGTIEWEPQFTFHGFRYVELSRSSSNSNPEKSWVSGVVLHSDLKPIGTFHSSSDMLNQLQSNIVWGQRGNFLEIPTDCPQRDERMGWTGDAQVFCATSMFNYDCLAFWKSWLSTMRDDQFPDGRIPNVVPDILNETESPGWMDAATIIPWEVYVRTGDTDILDQNYEMMEKLVGWYRSQSIDGLLPNIGGFGDWLQPYAQETKGDTPSPLLGAAFYAKSASLLANAARVLGRDTDADKYAQESNTVKKAFAEHFFNKQGKIRNAPETQTAYVLSIAFDLVPEETKSQAAANLVRLINDAGGHLRTGFLGTPYIVRVLDDCGYPQLAYELLLKETYPSWIYSIKQGATTVWERWNSYSHEHGFASSGMNSFNHYAYGAIGQWMYERVAGLTPDPQHPGYKHFFVRPLICSQLNSAKAELETPYGKAASSWVKQNNIVLLNVIIPPNTTATIMFPDNQEPCTVGPGTHKFECVYE